MDRTGQYGDIAPFSDAEAAEAIAKLRRHPLNHMLSKYLFPNEKGNYLNSMLEGVSTVDDFQQAVMSKAVRSVLERTSDGLTYEGLENIREQGDRRFLAISNHRDIVLDPAIIQYILFTNGLPITEIAVGDNLLSSELISCLLRCNRMIKVIRGISARELYLSSQQLSGYIRHTIVSGDASVWIAQKEGRTKNGIDLTEQGLLKMFDMSGEKGFVENFMELNIIPISISYEYESCDIRKAREVLISRDRKYVKKPHEDTHSIITGISQPKGHIHLHFGRPLSREQISMAGDFPKNDRYQYLRSILTREIQNGYKLWKTNYMAYDLMTGSTRFADRYDAADLEGFRAYVEMKLNRVEKSLNREQLRDIFLHIYGNPVAVMLDR
ncbi:MAG: 1-acyl-sn-glycerol-3-phosphate acyltransferase [Bacteroidales bacterium]|nr:1-acyl-sn-glycerol-3-phosphate acyltransferase [Bacteroidales bacterium]